MTLRSMEVDKARGQVKRFFNLFFFLFYCFSCYNEHVFIYIHIYFFNLRVFIKKKVSFSNQIYDTCLSFS